MTIVLDGRHERRNADIDVDRMAVVRAGGKSEEDPRDQCGSGEEMFMCHVPWTVLPSR